jgi:hypothetical protein
VSEFRIRTPDGKSEKWIGTTLYCPRCGEQGLAKRIGARQVNATGDIGVDLYQCPSDGEIAMMALPRPSEIDYQRSNQLHALKVLEDTGGTGQITGSTRRS